MTRILVVEDEPSIALGLEDDLRMEGWEVELVTDGAAAATRARQQTFDLVLLDVMLPGRDGFDVCREMRRAGLRVPIIILTAKALELEKVMGLDSGADDYVTKPFSPKELRARIRAHLRRAAGGTELLDVYRFGDMEVDAGRCELRRSGAVVEITSTEFKLLLTFIRNQSRVLTREKLIDAVWGPGTFLTDRVVGNHIVALRRKIEPEPAKPKHLVSIRGVGYRFDG